MNGGQAQPGGQAPPSELGPARGPLGSLHALHWVIIALSVALTSSAWWIARSQHKELVESRFHRERDQLVELIRERMQKYEDALWAGASAVQANGGAMSPDEWAVYADSLGIERKYPGVNGVGIVLRVGAEDVAGFTRREQESRPAFRVFPEHERASKYPIFAVEPLANNAQAIGLDMAFEANRRTALERAIAEGTSQVTGPITLVQDDAKTPGFLFYAPYYRDGGGSSESRREERFLGAVYAPFVTSKLMEGTLRRDSRRVLVRIEDGAETVFNEHSSETPNYDADPMFRETVSLELYGRTWVIDAQTDAVFRANASSAQSTMILVGGICIDAMLIAFFVMLSRERTRAFEYADKVTEEIRVVNRELTAQQEVLLRSNSELEQFAYVASHDLQEPLLMVRSYSELLASDLEGALTPVQEQDLGFLTEGAQRMQTLVDDLLQFSRVDSKSSPYTPEALNLKSLLDDVLHDLGPALDEANVEVRLMSTNVWLTGDAGQLRQVLQNLISNAIKFQPEGQRPRIGIRAEMSRDGFREVEVKDNGIGIAPEMQERVFQIFQRLHTRREYDGSGLGLAIVKKVVERNGGSVTIDSEVGKGSRFRFTVPAAEEPRAAA